MVAVSQVGDPATAGAARLSRASLAPTDQTFLRGKRWASQAQRQPTGLRQLRVAEIRRALCRPEREAGCREQAAGMRRESALAQGCAIADAPGSLPVSEDSGGSGRQGRGLRGHGLMPPYRPRQAAGWQIPQADSGRNGPIGIDWSTDRPAPKTAGFAQLSPPYQTVVTVG